MSSVANEKVTYGREPSGKILLPGAYLDIRWGVGGFIYAPLGILKYHKFWKYIFANIPIFLISPNFVYELDGGGGGGVIAPRTPENAPDGLSSMSSLT